MFLYGSPASDKFSLVGRLNVHYPVENNRNKKKASGIFYFADESNLVECKPLLEANLFTHHIDTGGAAVSFSEPPARVNDQVKNCDPTPPEHVFSNGELLEIVKRAKVLRDTPPSSASIPSFVSMHKVFLVACVLCLFHSIVTTQGSSDTP